MTGSHSPGQCGVLTTTQTLLKPRSHAPMWLQPPPKWPGPAAGHLLQGGVEKVRSCLKFTQDMVSGGLDTRRLAPNSVLPCDSAPRGREPLTAVVSPCPEPPVAPTLRDVRRPRRREAASVRSARAVGWRSPGTIGGWAWTRETGFECTAKRGGPAWHGA